MDEKAESRGPNVAFSPVLNACKGSSRAQIESFQMKSTAAPVLGSNIG